MLFTKKQKEAAAEALLQWVPPEQLPAQYGGKCAVPLGESPLERDMARYVERLNAGAARAAAQAAAVDGGAQAAQAAGGGGSAQAAAGGGGGSAQATRSPFA